jgi:anti-anti-sigma regulatory factor
MLKITPTVQGDFAVLLLSGRIEEASIPQLESLINAEQRGIVLDLTEVTLVSRAGIRFLAQCEEAGIRIQNCPAYIREWISQERRAQ